MRKIWFGFWVLGIWVRGGVIAINGPKRAQIPKWDLGKRENGLGLGKWERVFGFRAW